MKKDTSHKILSRIVDIRPEEVSLSLLLFFYFFMVTLTAYIILPIKKSLFLQTLKPDKLPYAYLLEALLIGFVVSLNSKLLHTMKRQFYISVSLIFFIINLILFWVLLKKVPWLPLIFWLWEDIFLATSVTQFWIVVNDLFHPYQAKRLVTFFVSGGLLGGIVGSFSVWRLARTIGTENLLLVCPFALAFCLLLVNVVYRVLRKGKEEEKRKRKLKVGYSKSFQTFIKNRYLVILAGIMASAIVVTTLIDFQFNNIVYLKFPAKDAKTAFFGIFLMCLNVFAYLLHILATNRILKFFGIRVALLIAPFILLICSVTVFLVPMASLIYWGVIARGADKSLSHSLNQSVRELLYIPISPEVKYRAKLFIDMFINKLAKGFGAVLILVFFTFLHFNLKQISLFTIIFCLSWILLNMMITREFVGIVKNELKIKWIDADRMVSEKIDVDMTKLVFDTLQSKERSSVLYAMNLFDLIKKDKMSPGLRKLISNKSGEVRASSMDSLFELDGEVFLPESEDALDPETLDKEVKEIMSLDVYQQLMEEHIRKVTSEESKEAVVKKMEAAKVLGMMKPGPELIRNLKKLLKDKSPEVVRYAIESAGKLKARELVPHIIPQLKSPALQHVASRALEDFGDRITGTLKDYLGDQEENIRVRKAIPEILSRMGTQRAADVLVQELAKSNKEVEPEIIEALNSIRSKNPGVQFQEKVIQPEILQEIKKSYLILIELFSVKGDEKKALLAPDLENSLARSLRNIFTLISLIYQKEDIDRAYQNISAGTKRSIDYSIELLDNILKREVKEFLIPLIDDIPFENKVKRCKKLLKSLESEL